MQIRVSFPIRQLAGLRSTRIGLLHVAGDLSRKLWSMLSVGLFNYIPKCTFQFLERVREKQEVTLPEDWDGHELGKKKKIIKDVPPEWIDPWFTILFFFFRSSHRRTLFRRYRPHRDLRHFGHCYQKILGSGKGRYQVDRREDPGSEGV